jgi:hypothetical protein
MEKQITAIDWLINELDYETISKFDKKLLQAKSIEKEQIINAWIADDNPLQRLKAEQYYNKTFKK